MDGERAMTQDQASAQPISEEPEQKTILVVDDDVNIGLIIVELIQEETSHKAVHRTTGSRAIQALSETPAHLFIIDYQLPDMNGLELHDQLHRLDHLQNVPTVLISALKPSKQEMQKRMITFLAKPFDMLELLRIISRLLDSDKGWAR